MADRTIRVWHRHTGEVGGTDYQRLAESKARSSSAYELRDALSRLRRPVRSRLRLTTEGGGSDGGETDA